jgi:hypothetical protein
MLTKGAVEDVIAFHLSRSAAGAAAVPKKVPELKKRFFLSDLELRRRVSPGQKTVDVPLNAILSPLSIDWLEYDGVKVVRVY